MKKLLTCCIAGWLVYLPVMLLFPRHAATEHSTLPETANQTAVISAALKYQLASMATPLPPQRMSNLASNLSMIELRSGWLDTNQPQNHPSTQERTTTETGEKLALVQASTVINEDWIQQLENSGLAIVQYVPQNAFLVWGNLDALESFKLHSDVKWGGNYLPEYAIEPTLRAIQTESSHPITVTIQVYDHSHAQETLDTIYATALEILQPDTVLTPYRNLRVKIAGEDISRLAALPDVVNIEPWHPPQRLDEIQNQILAGTITTTLTGGSGYLDWLNALNFSNDPADYPVIDIVDDGVDNGTLFPDDITLYLFGNNGNSSRLIYANNCTADPAHGIDGHGHLNANIAGGYNAQITSPHIDANGFQRGQGVNPFGRLASTRIFNDSGSYDVSRCGSDLALVENSYTSGARISSNSWGQVPGTGIYNVSSQTYDTLTRDALPNTPGNQEMLFLFSAGNSGPNATTIGYPGTAKNVLTVGATESLRDNGISDGCGYAGDDNASDMAVFSSRGPTDDGRTGIDTVAAGIHIQGTTPLSGFTGRGVCGAPGDSYYPGGQTSYTWSSGTSHSTPAIAGAASLTTYWLKNRYALPYTVDGPKEAVSGDSPSPAMIAAYIAAHTRYLTGAGANENLPGNSQGWGAYDMGTAFDDTSRLLFDQAHLFGSSGQVFTFTNLIADSGKPLKIALAWTDAPGAPFSSAYVNDLNLEVLVGSNTYKGNNLSGNVSQPGGSFDYRNNTEVVYLPAGASGQVIINVTAANIPGDGVPNIGDSTDQDFALVCYNCKQADLSLLSSASPLTVAPGELLTYTLTANNNSGDLVSATITDTLPASTQFVRATQNGRFNGGVVSWVDVSIPAGETFQAALVVKAGFLRHDSIISNRYWLSATSGFSVSGNAVETPVHWPFDQNGCLVGQTIMWQDNHEDGDSDWAIENAIGSNNWTLKNDGGYSGDNYRFVADVGSRTDSRLYSPIITATADNLKLHFWHHFSFEATGSNYYDGGVVELSVNGKPFTDTGIIFVQNGYNGTIYNNFENPLGGRRGFGGNPFSDYVETIADLSALADVGDTVQLRFRQANDNSLGGAGWFLDDVALVGCSFDSSFLTITKQANRNLVAPNSLLRYTLTVSNTGLHTATLFITDTIPAGTTFARAQPEGVLIDNVIGWGFTDVPPNRSLSVTLVVTAGNLVEGTPITNSDYGVFVYDSQPGEPITTAVAYPKPVFLPLVMKDFISAPDLVIETIIAQTDTISLVIKNQGNAPVVNEFWVDAYINPNPPPSAPNQTWPELADQGLVWGVETPAVAQLVPGGRITLTIDDAYFRPELSAFNGLVPGDWLYAQVDSANANSSYGAVLENHEIRSAPYNNITRLMPNMVILPQVAPFAAQSTLSNTLFPPR